VNHNIDANHDPGSVPDAPAPESPVSPARAPHSPGPAILKKMAAVMADVDYLQKGEKNSFHNYTYVGERQVKEALHAAFVKHGIVPKFDFVSAEIRDWAPTGKGKAQYLTEIAMTYAFYDVETGECLSGTSVAHGIDGEDKGVYKAITQGIKYALTSAFLIPTGDDAERPNDYEPPKPNGSADTHAGAPAASEASEPTAQARKLYKQAATAFGIQDDTDPSLTDFHTALAAMCGVAELKDADPFNVIQKTKLLMGLDPRGARQMIKQNRAQNPAPVPVAKKRGSHAA